MTSPIKVVPYDSQWPEIYEREAELIMRALGDKCIGLHHVGSTSVPGLAAKPIIDIIAVVKNNLDIQAELQSISYSSKGEFHILFRQYFTKTDGDMDFHLHVYEEEHAQIELNILFRDYLRANKDVREAYASLKHELIRDPKNHEKRGRLFTGYNLGKDRFIKEILNRAGFRGVSVHLCAHNSELEAARVLFQKYLVQNPKHMGSLDQAFDQNEQAHLVLYQGTDIVGYAHIQFEPQQRASIPVLIIDDPHQGQGLQGQFLDLCGRWLAQKGLQII